MKHLLLGASLGLLCAGPLSAAMVSIPATADTGLFEDFPNNNTGAAGTVSVGTLAGNLGNTGASRMLVAFDLTGHVPPGAVIQSASVNLRVTKTPSFGAVGSTFALHRVVVAWGEGAKGLGTTTGSGAAASAGEATWNNRFHAQTAWSSPGGSAGGDYVATPSTSVAVSGVATYTFPSSAAMVADVQAWVDDPAPNHGWIVISSGEGTLRTARRVATSEFATTTQRPVLNVTFTVAPIIQSVSLLDSDIRMEFMVQQGMRYEVQRRAAAGSGPWMTFTNLGPAAATTLVTVADRRVEESQFYQVVEFGP